jgi:uncharacterized protein (TIGR02145 family)
MKTTLLALCLIPFAASWAQSDCGWNPDYDGDDHIGVADLLGLLGVFEEQDSDGDGVFDSMDDCLGVYDACGVCAGTGVDADGDGICDDIDPCVGEADACGVCNGPGPTLPILQEVLYATDSVFIDALAAWYVFEYPVDSLFTYVCWVEGCTDELAPNFNPAATVDDGTCVSGPEQCGGLAILEYAGHAYPLVGIGEQCWFGQNLQSTTYANGDPIPGPLSPAEWASTSAGAQCAYGANGATYMGSSDAEANFETFGLLYNGWAAADPRNVCPAGWRAATEGDWQALEAELGMPGYAINSTGYRGTTQGQRLKASPADNPGWDGTNVYGFSILPGGFRYDDGSYDFQGEGGTFWTGTLSVGGSWFRDFSSGSGQIGRDQITPSFGASIRCVLVP